MNEIHRLINFSVDLLESGPLWPMTSQEGRSGWSQFESLITSVCDDEDTTVPKTSRVLFHIDEDDHLSPVYYWVQRYTLLNPLTEARITFLVLGYGLDDWGFKSCQRLGIFLFTTTSRLALGPTQPPIQWVLGALSLGCKVAAAWIWPLTSI
jgi:hypothetical protein